MSLDVARQAYLNRDIELSKKAHENEQQVALNEENPQTDKKEDEKFIPHDEKHQSAGEFIKSAVYGGLDGMITTYSVVMGVLGANLSISVVLALGVANLIGDGISMALGDYLSTKSETEFHHKERSREEWEVDNNPDGEKREMIEIYKSKGIENDDAVLIVEKLSHNKKVWVDVMMTEELGLMGVSEHPVKDAIVTFFSFGLFGLVPLIPFIVGSIAGLEDGLFIVSTVMTGLFLFILGVAKSMFSYAKWYLSGLETLLIGACAAAASYGIGYAFEGIEIG